LQAGDAVQELPNITLYPPSHTVSLKVSLLQIMIRITDSEICTERDQYVSVYTIRRLLAIESSWKVWPQHG
jgi:hypothetical protein